MLVLRPILASYRTTARSLTVTLVRDGPIGHDDSYWYLVA